MTSIESVRVDLGGLSHPGRVRENNEDHFLIARFERSLRVLLTNLPPDHIPADHALLGHALIVADGVGGARAGEVASAGAIRELVNLVSETPDWIMRPDGENQGEAMLRAKERFAKINQVIQERASATPELSGMATTMTVCLSLGEDLLLAHLGDSRAYFLRDGTLHQLTRDDTMAQALIDAGVLAPEKAEKHPFRHVLTDALGVESFPADVELRWMKVRDGDRLLVCTDGLSDMLPDATIAEALGRDRTAAETCTDLVEQALAAGGKDNVTVVVARYWMGR